MKNKKLSALSLGAVLAVTLLTSEHAFSQELTTASVMTPNDGHMPYRQLNVGQNYLKPGTNVYTTSAPLIGLLPYLPNPANTPDHTPPSFKLDGTGGIYSYLSVDPAADAGGKPAPLSSIVVMKNVTEQGYDALKSSGACSTTGTINPDSIICKVKVTNTKTGNTSVLPVIVYNGLRAKTVEEMISNRVDTTSHTLNKTKPYLLRVSGTTQDFATAKEITLPSSNGGSTGSFLSNYFYIPASKKGSVTYTLDGNYLSNSYSGTSQAPSTTDYDAVRYITSLTSNNHWRTEKVSTSTTPVAGKPAVYIKDGNLFVQDLQPGMYQVNVRAEWKASVPAQNEYAFQTFYIAVFSGTGSNAANETFSAWQNGAVPPLNMFGAVGFNSIYAYVGFDPVASPVQFKQTLGEFAQDISELNNNQSTYLRQPIKTVMLQIATMAFTGEPSSTVMHLTGTNPSSGGGGNPNTQIGGGFWPLTSLGASNPYNQIAHNQLKSSRPNLSKWFNSIVGAPLIAIRGHGQPVRATVLYDFDGPLKSEFNTLNAKQRAMLADWITNQITSSGDISGTGFDLEGSFTQPAAVAFYKYLTDKLVYNGRWLSYFAFSNYMTPAVVASLGPLGVTGISTYDVGTYRAPQNKTTAELLPATVSYIKSGYSSAEATALFGDSAAPNMTMPSNAPFGYQVTQRAANGQPIAVATNDILCTEYKGGYKTNQVLTPSGCNLSLNDSYSENSRIWNESYHAISPHDAVKYFAGNYQPTLPIAASATEWNAAQIWQPNLSVTRGAVMNGGNILKGTAAKQGDPCYGVNNAFLATVDPNSPNSPGYQRVEKCLFGNVKIGSVPVQSFTSCGTNPLTGKVYPLNQCIQVSNLPSTSEVLGIKSPINAKQTQYDHNNLMVYADSYANHSAGYSLFALETAAVTLQHGDYNPGPSAPPVNPSKNPVNPVVPNMLVTEPYAAGMHEGAANKIDPYYNLSDVEQQWKNFGKMYTDFFHEYGPKASD